MRILPKIYSSILSFSLLFGAFFAPFTASASFLSSIFGSQASADTTADSLPQSTENSQTMTLLQANISSASIFQEKDNKNNIKDNTIGNISANTDIHDNALRSLGVSDEKDAIDPSSCGEPDIYVVADGDSISKIAKKLGVTEDTVLAANDMKKELVKYDVLFVPSVSGVEHTVTKGQTLQGIAKFYKADVSDIAFCNGITPDAKLKTGISLVIPSAKMPASSAVPKPSSNQPQYYATNTLESTDGYFINPVPGYRLSQGLHDGNAVDLAIAKGTPIHAAASGRIIFAKAGSNGGFGWLVIIAHPNGMQTIYAHMSKIIVHAGDQVAQGQIIGNVGSTGHSTGPHLHFVVKGGFNPGVNGSWAN